ncbi:MAG TPA: hypothetical protein VFL34_19805 [Candidatus Sulfotelmatobacter sp.]|nr:hypothetical protein [Candidatus Sulfotelmatobacter sp.]
MPESKTTHHSAQERDKSQDVVPPGREPVTQGQQFDEMQRQQKNPDGSPQKETEP